MKCFKNSISLAGPNRTSEHPSYLFSLQKGQEWIVEWWPQEGPLSNPQNEVDNPKKRHRKLLRCSGCKQALYCSQNCQKMDWNVS